MLVLVGGIGGCENDLAMANGEREIGCSLGEYPDSGFCGDSGVNLVTHMVNAGGSVVVRRDRVTMVVRLVRHVVHVGAASVRGIITCSGWSRGVPVGEGFMMVVLMV